jgi:hypothetical protein
MGRLAPADYYSAAYGPLSMIKQFRRLGLQRRIMLYVTVGLALMFGVLAIVGLDAIDQATQLVFRERLSTASTTAGIMDRDFARVAADAREAGRLLSASGEPSPEIVVQSLLERFKRIRTSFSGSVGCGCSTIVTSRSPPQGCQWLPHRGAVRLFSSGLMPISRAVTR